MEQKLVEQNMKKMIADEKNYVNELYIMRKIYLSGPSLVSYLDIRKNTQSTGKVLDICKNLYKQGLLEKGFVKDEKIIGVESRAYKISDPVYDIIVNYVSNKSKLPS